MSYRIVPTGTYARELKRLCRKYPSLRQTIENLLTEIRNNPKTSILKAKLFEAFFNRTHGNKQADTLVEQVFGKIRLPEA